MKSFLFILLLSVLSFANAAVAVDQTDQFVQRACLCSSFPGNLPGIGLIHYSRWGGARKWTLSQLQFFPMSEYGGGNGNPNYDPGIECKNQIEKLRRLEVCPTKDSCLDDNC